jgi:hypothetical protein
VLVGFDRAWRVVVDVDEGLLTGLEVVAPQADPCSAD